MQDTTITSNQVKNQRTQVQCQGSNREGFPFNKEKRGG